MSADFATVAQVMRAGVPACTLRTPVLEVARRMREEGIRTMIVASAGSDLIAGTISDLDLLRAVIDGRTEGMAADVMNEEAPATVDAAEPLPAALARLASTAGRLLVVVSGSPARPVGVLGPAEVAALVAGR